jgi:hypothetical protein
VLKPAATLQAGVTIAKAPPTIDFLYFPGQAYPGKPWSAWGDSLAVGPDKYYTSIGDHLAPSGNAFVFEYDASKKTFRRLLDLKKLLNLPDGHYTPGKIHGRLDMGDDGWLYCSTHRGSPRVTNDQYHYKGDWIVRTHPATGECEVVAHAPVSKHCIPNSVLDPKRLIFYGGTAAGSADDGEGIQFFAFDVAARKRLYAGPDGPARYMIFAHSTGRVYYTQGNDDEPLMRYDPAQPSDPPQPVPGKIGIRAATQETPDSLVYTVSQGQRGDQSLLYSFNTRTEGIRQLGPAAVGDQQYIASLDADPTGRYLYYVAGAHGGSDADGTPVVQFDTRSGKKKVIAFLHPFYRDRYGAILRGTYSSALSPDGGRLYITWNTSRGGRAWDCCSLTVIHIPESERTP